MLRHGPSCRNGLKASLAQFAARRLMMHAGKNGRAHEPIPSILVSEIGGTYRYLLGVLITTESYYLGSI